MRKPLALLLILSITAYGLLFATVARAADDASVSTALQDAPGALFSPAQLDNLVAPVALYPDPLLAQVVVAATFPDQIDEAARFLRAGANARAIDDQPWDVSVKAVAHYSTVLYMMADNLDWTTSLGQAYVDQSTDVMTAVQRLRAKTRAAGHLVTTPQMEVVVENNYIALWPVHPGTLYVPIYDPALVFYHHSGYRVGPVISFGVGFAIGAWLNYDFDWHHHRVYYHGWSHRSGWVHRCRPHVHVTNVYVNRRYTHVRTNRTVVNRRVDYRTLKRYNAVHRDVRYDNVRSKRFPVDAHDIGRARRVPGERREVPNKVIRRNYAPRIDSNRSRQSEQRPGWTKSPIDVRPAPEQRQSTPRKDVRPAPEQRQSTPRKDVRPMPEWRQTTPQRETRPAPRPYQTMPRVEQPQSQQQNRQMQRREESVFRGDRTRMDPPAARQRGQSSRQQADWARPPVKSLTPRSQAPSRRGGSALDAGGGRERMERR